MEYFLVHGKVHKTEYMGKEQIFDDMRLVKASSAEEAEQKYEKYWADKTSEYSIYYYATGYAEETIL